MRKNTLKVKPQVNLFLGYIFLSNTRRNVKTNFLYLFILKFIYIYTHV